MLTRINALSSSSQLQIDLFALIADMHMMSSNAFFAFGAAADLINPQLNIAQLSCGGYLLGDKSVYDEKDADNAVMLREYRVHIKNMLSFIDSGSDVDKQANAAFNVCIWHTRTQLYHDVCELHLCVCVCVCDDDDDDDYADDDDDNDV